MDLRQMMKIDDEVGDDETKIDEETRCDDETFEALRVDEQAIGSNVSPITDAYAMLSTNISYSLSPCHPIRIDLVDPNQVCSWYHGIPRNKYKDRKPNVVNKR
ncbi:hypothetical protein Tco_1330398 [Tanacetum coccineum]